MEKETHGELCDAGKLWLSKTVGCRVAVSELVCVSPTGEIPDVIGWKAGRSILIECKTSRSDFLVDKKKVFREYPDMGMGCYRLYLCPDGLIKPSEIPTNWGLLYYHPDRKNKIERVVCFKGNVVMDSGCLKMQPTNFASENALLLSLCSRLFKRDK